MASRDRQVSIFICCDCSSYMRFYGRYASESVNKLLVGNKNDLTSQRAVSFEQGKVRRIDITQLICSE